MPRRPHPHAPVALLAVILLAGVPALTPIAAAPCPAGACPAPENSPAWIARYDSTGGVPATDDLGEVGRDLVVTPDGALVVAAGDNRNAPREHRHHYDARTGSEGTVGFATLEQRVVQMEPGVRGASLYKMDYIAPWQAATITRHFSLNETPFIRSAGLDGIGVLDADEFDAADLAPQDIAVGPTGRRVAVVGDLLPRTPPTAVAGVTFDAETDAGDGKLWARARDRLQATTARAAAFGPTGEQVIVAGAADGNLSIAAYDADNGSRRWATTYDGPPGPDRACCVAVVGDAILATGTSHGSQDGTDVTTVALNATTGVRRWVRTFDGPGDRDRAVVAQSADDTLYVLAESGGETIRTRYALVAYTASGAERWTATKGDLLRDLQPVDLDVGPFGETVYVAASSWRDAGPDPTEDVNAITFAHATRTGEVAWTARLDPRPAATTVPAAIRAGPTGQRVFLTGHTIEARQVPGAGGVTNNTAMLTWAYNVAPHPPS